MYICIECGGTFEDPVNWKEDRGEYFGFPAYEEYWGSPCCRGDYTEAKMCDGCGNWIQGDYIKTKNGERLCEDCFSYMQLGDED